MPLSLKAIAFITLCIICQKHSDAAVGKAFSGVVPDSNIGGSCATEVPSKEEFASSLIHCGVLCTAEPACTYFSYMEETQRCLIFDSLPTTFASVASCYSYGILVSVGICRIFKISRNRSDFEHFMPRGGHFRLL